MNNVRAISKLSESELKLGSTSASWHDQYKHSSIIFVGGFAFDLTEGDIICIFSQYGEILDIHLVRDKESGKSKGYAFLKYEDQRSTILAVDNLNGISLLNRVIRVDHVHSYRRPERAPEWKVYEDKYGGNAAPEIWKKSLDEMKQVEMHREEPISSEEEEEVWDEEDPMAEYLRQERKRRKWEEKRKEQPERNPHHNSEDNEEQQKRKGMEGDHNSQGRRVHARRNKHTETGGSEQTRSRSRDDERIPDRNRDRYEGRDRKQERRREEHGDRYRDRYGYWKQT